MCKGDFILLSGASFGLVGRRLGGSKIWAERLHRKMKYQTTFPTTFEDWDRFCVDIVWVVGFELGRLPLDLF